MRMGRFAWNKVFAGGAVIVGVSVGGLVAAVALDGGPDEDTSSTALRSAPEPLGPPAVPPLAREPHGIVFVSVDARGKPSAFATQLDGGGFRRLRQSFTEALAEEHRWSPDHSMIAFWRGSDLYVIDLNGRRRRLADGAGEFAWSPDGSRVAYNTDAGIDVVRADGTGRKTVARGFGVNIEAWGADGRIYFYRPVATHVIDADGTDERRFADEFLDAAWSPDGKRVAFRREDYSIWVMGTDGSNARQVSGGPTQGMEWSPDGTRFAYVVNGAALLVIDVRTGDTSEVAELVSDSSFAWSPDGRRIAYEHAYEGEASHDEVRGYEKLDIWLARADGSERRRITNGYRDGTSNRDPEWVPVSLLRRLYQR